MKYEILIARKLKLRTDDSNNSSSAPILNIAIAGIILAIVIMLLSITIVCGFKREITTKIYNLDAHIKITQGLTQDETKLHPIDISSLNNSLDSLDFIKSSYLLADCPVVLKTPNDFKGISLRGVTKDYDNTFLQKSLIAGKFPLLNVEKPQIAISSHIANQLHLKAGDSVLAYFIDNNIKVRNFLVSGIFVTDFEDFDNNIIIGDIATIQQIYGWNSNQGTALGITSIDPIYAKDQSFEVYESLLKNSYEKKQSVNYDISNVFDTNLSYFAWLDLLDTNIVIILILMSLVSAFTLIAALLIIVLEKINTIGLLKAMGASNKSIRKIFILLTQKLIFKALVIGNIISLTFALIQDEFHIIKLNPEAYYMSFVPIEINWWYILILNVSIILLAYLTLIIPSYIVSNISPTKSMRYE